MNKAIKSPIVIGMSLLMMASLAGAVEYIDIDQPDGFGTVGLLNWHQTFVPTADNITAISVQSAFDPMDVTVRVLDAACGTLIAHGSGSGGEFSWIKCDLVGDQALVPGNTYAFEVSATSTMLFNSNNPYSDGVLTYDDCSSINDEYDLVFRTWAETEPIPADDSNWGDIKSMYR